MKEALEAASGSMGGYGFDTDNFPDCALDSSDPGRTALEANSVLTFVSVS